MIVLDLKGERSYDKTNEAQTHHAGRTPLYGQIGQCETNRFLACVEREPGRLDRTEIRYSRWRESGVRLLFNQREGVRDRCTRALSTFLPLEEAARLHSASFEADGIYVSAHLKGRIIMEGEELIMPSGACKS